MNWWRNWLKQIHNYPFEEITISKQLQFSSRYHLRLKSCSPLSHNTPWILSNFHFHPNRTFKWSVQSMFHVSQAWFHWGCFTLHLNIMNSGFIRNITNRQFPSIARNRNSHIISDSKNALNNNVRQTYCPVPKEANPPFYFLVLKMKIYKIQGRR